MPSLLLLLLLLIAALATSGEVPVIAEAKDQAILTGFLSHVAELPKTNSAEVCRKKAAEDPESYSWIILKYQRLPLTAYRLTGEVKHLDLFVSTFANLRAAMTPAEDGLLDWHGLPLPGFRDPAAPQRTTAVMITSFSAAHLLAEFVEIIDADPVLRERFAEQRAAYLDLACNHLVKKWEVRGNAVDLGQGGVIYRTEAGLAPTKSALTQPHNKHAIIVHALLALYRATSDASYMRQAVQVGTRFKRSLTLKDGHYEWNYWDPAGAWDVHPDDAAKWKHWIGPEHKGGYYAHTLSQAVALHEHGVVFSKTDIERFVRTQLEKCWNGDALKPAWARVDGTAPAKYTQGAYMCAALAPYAPPVEAFCFTGLRQEERVKNAAHGWQGAIMADGYLTGKFLNPPAERARLARFGERFRAEAANQALLRELEFTVEGAGYQPPRTPAEMPGARSGRAP